MILHHHCSALVPPQGREYFCTWKSSESFWELFLSFLVFWATTGTVNDDVLLSQILQRYVRMTITLRNILLKLQLVQATGLKHWSLTSGTFRLSCFFAASWLSLTSPQFLQQTGDHSRCHCSVCAFSHHTLTKRLKDLLKFCFLGFPIKLPSKNFSSSFLCSEQTKFALYLLYSRFISPPHMYAAPPPKKKNNHIADRSNHGETWRSSSGTEHNRTERLWNVKQTPVSTREAKIMHRKIKQLQHDPNTETAEHVPSTETQKSNCAQQHSLLIKPLSCWSEPGVEKHRCRWWSDWATISWAEERLIRGSKYKKKKKLYNFIYAI